MGFTKAMKGFRNLRGGDPMPITWKPKNKKKSKFNHKKRRRKLARKSRQRNRR